MQQRVKKIIEKLAKKYEITTTEAELAVTAYYEKVKEVLEKGNFPEQYTFQKILIPGFGRFIPNELKIKKADETRRESHFREYYLGEIPGYKLTPEYSYLQGVRDNYQGGGIKKDKTIQHEQPQQTGGGDPRGIQNQTEAQQDGGENKD